MRTVQSCCHLEKTQTTALVASYGGRITEVDDFGSGVFKDGYVHKGRRDDPGCCSMGCSE